MSMITVLPPRMFRWRVAQDHPQVCFNTTAATKATVSTARALVHKTGAPKPGLPKTRVKMMRKTHEIEITHPEYQHP
jgi:hypothetical protein